ncbi:SH3 domain-containing protein [Streptomyces sp. NPDC015220]|uniref:SH3 domain-containing protein n=1 Tax=Streptomyces sp. NPDC015220 TaxID=3364947 RepID=UPI0037013812
MIRRSLSSGLLAAVAVLALVPTAAEAAPAAPAPRTAATTPAPHLSPSPEPTPVRHVNQTSTHRRSNHPVGRVSTRHSVLNVRSGPGTRHRVIGVLHAGQRVALKCRTHGSRVHGTHQWYRLAHVRGYVSAHYVRVRAAAVPWC